MNAEDSWAVAGMKDCRRLNICIGYFHIIKQNWGLAQIRSNQIKYNQKITRYALLKCSAQYRLSLYELLFFYLRINKFLKLFVWGEWVIKKVLKFEKKKKLIIFGGSKCFIQIKVNSPMLLNSRKQIFFGNNFFF